MTELRHCFSCFSKQPAATFRRTKGSKGHPRCKICSDRADKVSAKNKRTHEIAMVLANERERLGIPLIVAETTKLRP